MEVTDALVAAVPEYNVRVPLGEFAAMWRAAEGWYGVWTPDPRTEGRITGITETCRWLAGVSAEAPASGRRVRATWTTIEDEIGFIDDALGRIERGAPPAWTLIPLGRGEGVIVTFAWAWLGAEPPVRSLHLPGTGD